MNIQSNFWHSNYTKPTFRAITGFDPVKIEAGIDDDEWLEGIVSSKPELDKIGEKVNINFSVNRLYRNENAVLEYTITEIDGKKSEKHTFFTDMMAVRGIKTAAEASKHFLKCIRLNVDKFLESAQKQHINL